MFIEIDDKSSILVVDADPTLRENLDFMFNGNAKASLSNSIADLSFLILGCENAKSALLKLQESFFQEQPYNLAFVDSHLEDSYSLDLISKLWQIDSDLHIVLCNSDPQLSCQQIVETLGESDQLLILQKPFSDLEVWQIVHAMMRKWQLNKQSQNVMRFMEEQIHQRTCEIEETHRQLLQAEKLASVGQLASGLAHEINTPAQYVGDNINALKDFFACIKRLVGVYQHAISELGDSSLLGFIQEQERKEDLEYILEDAPHAIEQSLEGISQIVKIVRAMKGFSPIGQSRVTSININLALENTLLVARNSYKNLADIEEHFEKLPAIECFPGELNQVFLIIIVNAADAIEESNKGRGKITIVTQVVGDEIEIRISDTGSGIPENIRDRIFDPFFTTKDVNRGKGQGLNVAYQIICQQHGGKIYFQTENGVGTTFIIRLSQKLIRENVG